MSTRSLTLTTPDGLSLEAELATPERAPRAAAVLCHPHPQYGGTMRSIVIGALFDALPAAGITCLRFNFRGVERSTGAHDDGHGELLDVRAALATLAEGRAGDEPVVLAGWSFGATSSCDGPIFPWSNRSAAWARARPHSTLPRETRA